MTDEERLTFLLSKEGMSLLLKSHLPECRLDGAEVKLAPGTQMNRLGPIEQVRKVLCSGYWIVIDFTDYCMLNSLNPKLL